MALDPDLLHRNNMQSQQFSGMAFPFGPSVLETFGPKSDEDVIRTSIQMILLTSLGERVMRPTFGSNVGLMLFDPNDKIFAIMLKNIIQDSLDEWENRVIIGQVEVSTPEGTSDDTVVVRIPVVISRPEGSKEINMDISLDKIMLFNSLE